MPVASPIKAPPILEEHDTQPDEQRQPERLPLPSAPETVQTPPLPPTWLAMVSRHRAVPRPAKWALATVAALVLLMLIAPSSCRGAGSPDAPRNRSESLRHPEAAGLTAPRRHRSEKDFQARVPAPVPETPAVAPRPDESSPTPSMSLEERRRRRAQSRFTGSRYRPRPKGPRGASENSVDDEEDLLVVWDAPSTAPKASGGHAVARVPAGTRVRIRLTHDVQVEGGAAPVVAELVEPAILPPGTTLVGRARGSRRGRVRIAIQTIVLPGGRSHRAQLEVVDPDTGSSDLVAEAIGGRAPKHEPGVAETVGRSAAERTVLSALGAGALGQVAGDTVHELRRSEKSSHRGPASQRLSRGTPLEALFLREFVIKPGGGAPLR